MKVQEKIGAVSAAYIVFVATFFLLHQYVAHIPAWSILIMLPAIMVGVFWGLKAGIFSGILSFGFAIFLAFLQDIWFHGLKLLPETNIFEHVQAIFLFAAIPGLVGYMADIARRAKKQKRQLQESEQRFRTLADFTYSSEYWISPDNNLIYQSPSIERITGYTAEEFIENHPGLFSSIVHPSDKEQFGKHFEKDLSSSEVTRLTFRIISRSGEVRWLENVTRPVYDNEGNFLGRRGSSQEITERRQMEERLRESEEKYRTFVNNIPDIAWTADSEGHTIFLSPNVETINGYTPDEICKADDRLWFGRICLEDIENVMSAYKALFKKEQKFDIEYRIKRKDGKWIWLHDRAVATYEKDGLLYADGLYMDITERKQMEEDLRQSELQFRAIADNTYASEYWIDPDNNLIYQSPSIELMTGYTAEELVKNHPGLFSSLVHPEDKEQFRKHFENDLRSSDVARFTFRITKGTGEVRWLENITRPVFDNEGNFLGRRGSSRDITERKQAEEELRESEERLTAFMDSATDIFSLWDSELNLIRENEAGMRIFPPGTKREDVYGRNMEDILPGVKESGRLDEYKKVIKTGKPFFAGDIIPHPQFGKAYLNVTAFKVVDGLGLIVRDITKRKKAEEALRESEERWRNLVQNIPAFIVEIDLNGKILAINKTQPGLSLENFLDKSVFDVAPPPGHDRLKSAFAEVIDKGILVEYEYEAPDYGPEKTSAWYHDQLAPVMINDEIKSIILIITDITKRKQTEEALKESEERFSLFMDYLPAATFIKDNETRAIYVNKYMNDVFGAKDWIGKTALELFPKDVAEAMNADDNKSLTKGYWITVESIPDKHGINHIYQTHKFRIERSGKPSLLGGIALDITERMRAEKEIKKFKAISDKAGYGVGIIDLKGYLLYLNETFSQIHGYTVDELLGKHVSILHTEEQLKNVDRLNEQLVQEGSYVAEEVWHKRKDGNIFLTQMNGTLINDEKGQPLFMAATIIDITERKRAEEALRESEERFSAFMKHLPFTAYIKDQNLRNVFVNERMLKMCGNSMSEVIGSTVHDSKTPAVAERLEKAYRKVLDEDVPIELENSMTMPNGEKRYWRDVLFPIHMPNERLVGGVAINTTAQKRVEEQLKASLREKETLLQEIHHRVKNNMQVVASLSRMQARRSTDDSVKKALQAHQNRIMAMAVVHELLYESESLSDIDLGKYIKRLSGSLAEMYKSGSKIELHIDTEEITIGIDKASPYGIVLNELIANSFKHAFTEDQSGQIQIKARSVNDEIEIVIKDNGQGMPEDIDVKKSETMGHMLVKGLVESQLHGTWDMSSGKTGTKHSIRFKKAE